METAVPRVIVGAFLLWVQSQSLAGGNVSYYSLLYLFIAYSFSLVNTDGLLMGLGGPAHSQMQIALLAEGDPSLEMEGTAGNFEFQYICDCRQSGVCCESNTDHAMSCIICLN